MTTDVQHSIMQDRIQSRTQALQRNDLQSISPMPTRPSNRLAPMSSRHINELTPLVNKLSPR